MFSTGNCVFVAGGAASAVIVSESVALPGDGSVTPFVAETVFEPGEEIGVLVPSKL